MMKGYLLDVNLLLALAWPNHVHHRLVRKWFNGNLEKGWTTTSMTQLGFVRLSSHPSFSSAYKTPAEARALLKQMCSQSSHVFWPEPPEGVMNSKLEPHLSRILTHRQVTDFWLAAIAIHHGGKLATLDEQLSHHFPTHTELVGRG